MQFCLVKIKSNNEVEWMHQNSFLTSGVLFHKYVRGYNIQNTYIYLKTETLENLYYTGK